MSQLVIPGRARPSNLRVPPELVSAHIEGDVYNICERLAQEFGDRLFIVMHLDHEKPYVIMEKSDDGTDYVTCRYAELSGQILHDLRHMRAIPIERRLAEFEKQEAIEKEKTKEAELDSLWANMGERMHYQLKKDNFIEHNGKVPIPRGVHGRTAAGGRD